MSSTDNDNGDTVAQPPPIVHTRAYQQELLDESLHRNLIIALDTGSGKTHIAVLRMKHEAERNSRKVSWFIAPTVALVEQQFGVISTAIPVPVGLVSGASEPNQWKDASLWRRILASHRIMVTTPQVLLDALHHAYVDLGSDIGLLVFDEAHHATGKHPYNMIMKNFYSTLPPRTNLTTHEDRVRPAVLGLTASPIYGGNVDTAFRELEKNLDSTIRSSRKNRDELAQHVYRPEFKHVLYASPVHTWDNIPSVNYQALQAVLSTLNIEDDPYVISMRSRLAKLQPGDDQRRLDQRLSKVIDKEDTFTHKGLRDFARAAEEICYELGTWSADWYIAKVIERAKLVANPYNNIMSAWQEKEKRYLLGIVNKVQVTEPPSDTEKILQGTSPKVRALVDSLIAEESLFRSRGEDYSGLVFVTRRDTVLALAELLRRIPETAQLFRLGCLLGTSSSFKRHSFLDITRSMLEESQADTLRDFKIGDKNLIVSTSVAEEGIDIQACGSVIRFDPPPNVVAWAQSRGRARRKRSSFIIMFEETGPQKVKEWEETERMMMAAYNDPRRDAIIPVEDDDDFDDMDGYVEFEVASTGALLTIHSAIPHLNHFCAVIPSGGQESHVPLYELDPPDYAEGWHLAPFRSEAPYPGPWGATVVLPRALPKHLRKFTTPRIHRSKRRAQQHVAFQAYVELFNAGLLDNHLLPLSSAIEPDKKEEVEAMLAEVAKRASTARVSIQMDPWAVSEETSAWYAHELTVEGLPTMRTFTRRPLPQFAQGDFPTLYIPKRGEASVTISTKQAVAVTEAEVRRARSYTYRLFFTIYGARMEHEKMDFSYLFLPAPGWPDDALWKERRQWQETRYSKRLTGHSEGRSLADAAEFGKRFSYPTDVAIVRGINKFDKPLRLVKWRHEPLSTDEEEKFREQYDMYPDLQISYPLMVVQPLPKRRNFLIPFTSESTDPRQLAAHIDSPFLLHPRYALVELASRDEVQYALMLPSILRWLANALTVDALRSNLFSNTPVSHVSLPLLLTAITAPASQELSHYQRLETLGDTVLKFISSNQLYAEFPLWHEGYLSRKKDHAVANSNLAKEAVQKGLYKWIIRDRFVPRKWKPHYAAVKASSDDSAKEEKEEEVGDKKKRKSAEELSTKMLADVVESLIGAAYEHGGFDLAIECVKRFGLGMSWKKLSKRIEEMHKVEDLDDLPEQLELVEKMLGYQFKRRTFLVQALTHASYQGDSAVMSLERLEFLGDSALDMVVTDYLYHAPGKNYSPGYMHIKKESAVNSHILAYVCLSSGITIESVMPTWTPETGLATVDDSQRIHLWQCLLHSSHRVLEDQNLTFARFQKHGPAIAKALQEDSVYPWAALTSLQAPKFISDMVESVLGAVYVDSMGNLDAVRQVMRSLGLMQIIERVVMDDVDVLHPVSRLAIWAGQQDPQRKVEYKIAKENGQVKCAVLIDEEQLLEVSASYRSRVSEDEVRFTAAERAMQQLSVTDVDMENTNPTAEDADGDVGWGDVPEYL
ncbi:P-loop containing nucleoside triphosphate hydrolase protein [Trametes coccinea BRFM310]|uniref:p-loop containing nucleoside triphosphate hydrolase protein n=1 Tax=Trametes coccinea (strain BRFM310) TaxID=1353009 RepID=A0A1Y2J3L2_TRAC3|nr:P-loop containing nucleoside triphosphate hydrolase protein [Trametes coccinea BRFM310]